MVPGWSWWSSVFLPLVFLHQSADGQAVPCYTKYNSDSGTCENLLDNVEQDDCCMNLNYAFTGPDGTCVSCGLPTWSTWSSWGQCSVTCKEGVTFRKRHCYGQGICPSDKLGTLQMKPCEVTCCPELSTWAEWGPWGPCSSTCEQQGSRTRQRVCSPKEGACSSTCEGFKEERGPCSVQVPCPVDGQWSHWEAWQQCSSWCWQENSALPTRTRVRFCSAPSPSTHTTPQGKPCAGPGEETEECLGLPFCPVHGAWGAWGSWGGCSVTCGVGRETQHRVCDSPAPKHRGNPCPGSSSQTRTCKTHIYCPVDGQWESWSSWSKCVGKDKRTCEPRLFGYQSRERDCLYTAHNGSPCPGDTFESRACFNINNCKFDGTMSEWGEWGLCNLPCTRKPVVRIRKRTCDPDLSKYPDEIGRNKQQPYFWGEPDAVCPGTDEVVEYETEQCQNVPACPLDEKNL